VGPTVHSGPIFWPMEQAPDLLRFYRQWSAEAPDELMTYVVQRRAPAVDFVPSDVHGQLVVAIVCCYTGAVEDGERIVRHLRAFGSPVLDLCEPKPYVAHQTMFDASFPHGRRYYFRACDVGELSDDVIDVMVEYGRRIVSPVTNVGVWQMGGAVSRVADSETAFNGRHAAFTFNINGNSRTAKGFERTQPRTHPQSRPLHRALTRAALLSRPRVPELPALIAGETQMHHPMQIRLTIAVRVYARR
jgi:hypothetical protein